MASLYLLFVVVSSTVFWMISRWAMQGSGDSRVQGFWTSIVGLTITSVILLLRHQSILHPQIIISGLIGAFAASIGFLAIMMYCLKIGPSGLTLTVNNSAMVFGIIYSFIFLDNQIPNLVIIIGITLTLFGLIAIGVSNSGSKEDQAGYSSKWLKLVMIGGAFSGISYCNQAYLGRCHPGLDNSIIFLFWLSLFSIPILLVIIYTTKSKLIKRRELIGGFSIGVLMNASLLFTLFSLQYLSAAIVFPICVAGPMVIMLLIGHFRYKEHLKPVTWIGTGMVIISVVLLSLKS